MKRTKIIVLFATAAVTLSLLLAACFNGQDVENSGEFATVTIRLGSADNSKQLVGINQANGTIENHTYRLSINGGSQIPSALSAANTLSFSVPVGAYTFEVQAYGDADEIWKDAADAHPFPKGSIVLRAVGNTSRVVTAAGPNTFQIGLYSATEVNTWAQLAWSVGGSPGTTRKEIIFLKDNMTANSMITIDRPIELRAESPVKITRGSGTLYHNGAFFDVPGSSNSGKFAIGATLEGDSIGATITLDGGDNGNPPINAPLITTGGDCIIGKDVTLQNNKNNSAGSYCGGVAINSGTLTLYGKITGNESSEVGGVYVASGGTLIMAGGIITQNTSSNGGGVHITSGGTFIMDGGIISQNNSSNGAGVYAEGTFTMNDGSITNNVASSSGGGVYVAGNGNFYINKPAKSGINGNVKENKVPTGVNNPNVFVASTVAGALDGDGLDPGDAYGW